MDSFVEAQKNLKCVSYAGCVTLLKTRATPRSTLLIHSYGHEVTGLKTYRGPKRKDGDAPVERRRPAERLSIFQYWFARCAVELWVRFREDRQGAPASSAALAVAAGPLQDFDPADVGSGSKPEVRIGVGHVRSNSKSRRHTRQPACLLRAVPAIENL